MRSTKVSWTACSGSHWDSGTLLGQSIWVTVPRLHSFVWLRKSLLGQWDTEIGGPEEMKEIPIVSAVIYYLNGDGEGESTVPLSQARHLLMAPPSISFERTEALGASWWRTGGATLHRPHLRRASEKGVDTMPTPFASEVGI